MCKNNQTEVVAFLLLGFQGLYSFKALLFTVFLIIYTVILNGNLLIIFLVTFNDKLKSPMFFFLKHLALSDILLTTNIIPNMLHIILKEKVKMLRSLCIFQLYFSGVSGFVQCFLLAVMSYDRFIAICYPFHYTSVMDPKCCLQLVIGSWFLVFGCISSGMVLIYQLQFCGFSYIDHFYCDLSPLLQLSSSDTSILLMIIFVSIISLILFPFVFIVITYVCIIITILKIPSNIGRKKAFSTCSSHLAIVCSYYGTLSAVYMGSSDQHSININKFKSLFYIVFTPLINPIIYSLRNFEIRRALKKLIKINTINEK